MISEFLKEWPPDYDNPLGQGRFGSVYRILDKPSYAIKIVDTRESRLRPFFREVYIMAKLGRTHPHITEVKDWYYSAHKHRGYIVMPLAHHGDLFKTIYEKKMYLRMSPESVVERWAEIVSGVYALHQLGFTHNDLKPENILQFDSPSSRSRMCPRLALTDFGYVRRIRGSRPTNYGSTMYGAPECFTKEYGSRRMRGKQDVWALGLILWNMLLSNHPWQYDSDGDVFHVRLVVPYAFPPWIRKLLRMMLRKHASRRITMDGLVLYLKRHKILVPDIHIL